jgi:primosomal protein N' (replication factor Y)
MRAEAEFRFAAGMPPFGRLAALILSGRDMVKLEQAARHLNDTRPQYDKVDVFGPAQAPLSRVRGQFRIRFLVRADRQVALQKIIGAWLSEAKLPSGVRVACDIDPYSFL